MRIRIGLTQDIQVSMLIVVVSCKHIRDQNAMKTVRSQSMQCVKMRRILYGISAGMMEKVISGQIHLPGCVPQGGFKPGKSCAELMFNRSYIP